MRTLNDLGSIILKWMLIVGVALTILYFGLSIWGNIAINQANKPPELPSLANAPYQVTFDVTGEMMQVDSYTEISNGIYQVDNYYSLDNGKWQLHKGVLELDEKYWGPITIEKRVK